MDPLFTIRGLIFLAAGLVCLLATDKLMIIQDKLLTKLKVKQRDSKKTTRILGIVFILIAVILIIYANR